MLAYGPHQLSDVELLAVILRSGQPGLTVIDLARSMLTRFGGLRGMLTAPRKELLKIRGLGPAAVCQLKCVQELARRQLREPLNRGVALTDPGSTSRFLIAQLRDRRQEVFVGLFLDNRHRLIAYEELFFGTIDGATVYPRVVVEKALRLQASALIVAHNHPSGIAEPSQSDQAITTRLQDALKLMDIRLLDHFVIGDGSTVSLAERGML